MRVSKINKSATYCILIICVTILLAKASSTFEQTGRIEHVGVYSQAFEGSLLIDSLDNSDSIYPLGYRQQSRTGPVPPPEVSKRDAKKRIDKQNHSMTENSLSVPAYLWRHGCGATAVGMVIGYYDILGYDDLIPGSALTQTDLVNQAIASGGDQNNPYPPGSESHYEDYARPQDSWPNMIVDDYITQERSPHANNCIADYMHTSQSTFDNYYGWSWSEDAGPAFVDYVQQQNSNYEVEFQDYYFDDETFNWLVLTGEIDSGRPMVFLVDTDGNDTTDHFVTVIDYRTHGQRNEYGCWDTWDDNHIRWEEFNQMSAGVPWGIWGAWAFVFITPVPIELTEFTGYVDGDKVMLNWSTATEVDNYGFDIERSVSDEEWEKIGFVEGHGNSNSPKHYSFTDEKPLGGWNFQYRLKQIDTDGDFEYSFIVEVDIVPTDYVLFQNYPNPFNTATTIKYSVPKESLVSIKIYNSIGEEVNVLLSEVKTIGNYDINFDASRFASGVYFYRLQSGNFIGTKKMVLMK